MSVFHQLVDLGASGIPHIPRPAGQMVGRQDLAGVFLLEKRHGGFGGSIVIPGDGNRVTLRF